MTLPFLLHNIGTENHPNYNSRSQIESATGLLTFDGVYKNVLDNRDTFKGKEVILFVMGDYVGGTNAFDMANGVPKLESYCTWEEIVALCKDGCKLGWHTWSHPDLTKLSYAEMVREITPPFPMKYFAYPHGKWNQEVITAVQDAGFEQAYSVHETDSTIWTIPRQYL